MYIFLNLDISQKKIVYFFNAIYGIGIVRSKKIVVIMGYDINSRINELKNDDLEKLKAIIIMKYKFKVDVELKRFAHQQKLFLQSIGNHKAYKDYLSRRVKRKQGYKNRRKY